MWIILIVVAAVVILLWMVIGYVGFRTAICRGHELNITDREALKGTSWDQYYEEIQEGIEWVNRQEAEELFQAVREMEQTLLAQLKVPLMPTTY